MTAWKRGLARSAWTAFLVLFAVRAIAGAVLCELYGEHPPAASAGTAMQTQAPHGVVDARKHANPPPADQPSHDRDNPVCEEPVYLTGEAAPLSAIKWPMTGDSIPWSHAPARDWNPAVAMVSFPPPQVAHPPLSRSPLDISPRLRI